MKIYRILIIKIVIFLGLFLTFGIAQAGSGASPAQLDRLFAALKLEQLTKKGVEYINERQSQKRLAKIVDPKEREQAKKDFVKIGEISRKYANWNVLKPFAIKSYTEHYSDADVDEAVDYFKADAGQIYVTKVQPAFITYGNDLIDYIDETVDKIFDDDTKKGAVKSPTGSSTYPPGSKESKILEYIRLKQKETHAEAEFENTKKTEFKNLEVQFKEITGKDNPKIMAAFNREFQYAVFETKLVRSLNSGLSNAEVETLLNDIKLPESAKIIRQLAEADRTFTKKQQEYTEKELNPKIIEEVFRVLKH